MRRRWDHGERCGAGAEERLGWGSDWPHPAQLIPLADLPARWLHHRVRVVAAGPGMPGRVRGAWGRRLMETASGEMLAGQPCPWVPPCTYDALFRERRLLPGLEMPKPFGSPSMRRGCGCWRGP